MDNSRVFCTTQLIFEEQEFVADGEGKPILKFGIHPNCSREERWILRKTDEEPKVFNIIRKRFTEANNKFVLIELEKLSTVSHTMFSEMLDVVPIKYYPGMADTIAKRIIFLARKRIAKRAEKLGNKSVPIGVKIDITTLKLTEEIEKVVEENERRKNHGSVPASYGSVYYLERVKLVEDCCQKCVICFREIVAGSTMIRTKCCHEFHAECITEWFSRINLCPRCRFEMPSGIFDQFLHKY